MKFFKFIIAILPVTGCNNSAENRINTESESVARLDSVRWFFYAYNFKNVVIFEKNGTEFVFKPVQCSLLISETKKNRDTITYFVKPFKESYNYKANKGFNVEEFDYVNGVFYPIVSMVEFDNFDKSDYVRSFNNLADSLFKSYLQETKVDSIDSWLLKYMQNKELKKK